VRIAVTGADGFLGTHLCEAFLARGRQVYGLVRNPDFTLAGTRNVYLGDGSFTLMANALRVADRVVAAS
jgi:nucleoside-diphosphate-sugar epimerase